MLSIDHSQIIKDLGKDLGIDLELDENDACDVLFDDRIQVTIKSFADDGIVTLSTQLLDSLPDPIEMHKVETLLSMSSSPCFNDGGNVPVVGLDEESGMVILYQNCTASFLSKETLTNIFTEFINARLSLEQYLTAESSESEITDFNKDNIIA